MLWTVARQAPLSMHFPGKNTGMGCHAFLQGIFPTQGSNSLFLLSPVLAVRFFTTSTMGSPSTGYQFSSVSQSCPTLCDPVNRSMSGLPVHHHLLKFIQTHIHWVGDAIQPSHPLSSPFPPAPNPSQHHSLFLLPPILPSFFQWANSSYEVAKVLEFQL